MNKENYGKGIDVGDGYELVPWDELSTMPRENGDIEFLDRGGDWVEFDINFDLPIRYATKDNFIFRRRKSQPANQWRKFSECKPEGGFIFLANSKKVYKFPVNLEHYKPWDIWTHWMPADVKLPQPPAPEKDEWRAALEKLTDADMEARDVQGLTFREFCFRAGFNAGRASK